MKKISFLFTLLVFLAACGGGPKESEKYPGYYETEDGTVFAIHSLGESGRKPVEGDWIEFKMSSSIHDSLIHDSELEYPSGTEMREFTGNKYFSVFAEGDSGTVLLPGTDLGYSRKDTMMLMNVKIIKIYSAAEHEALLKNPPKKDDELIEQQYIRRWLRKKKINASPDGNGLITLSESPGSGESPVTGDTVLVQYTGHLLGRGYFDEPANHPDGLEFILGVPDQMLDGCELAIRKMKPGGKMSVLIPSAKAWGKEGSVGQVIKPYTPVIFDMELIKVKKKKTT